MGLAPGTSIGHYDVTFLLGEGGMGHEMPSVDDFGRGLDLLLSPPTSD